MLQESLSEFFFFLLKFECILVNPVLGLFVFEVRTGFTEMHYQDQERLLKVGAVTLLQLL